MEAIVIALICVAALGAALVLTVFVRQLLLSRDKNLNDEAQRRAIKQEANELEKLRGQMESSKRFRSHYRVLGVNKDAIIYLDHRIEELFHKKTDLVERYALLCLQESEAIVGGQISPDRKAALEQLRIKIDDEIKFYDNEIATMQRRRSTLWDSRQDLQEYLLLQEKTRNDKLDSIYQEHSGLLEKIYLRHTEDSEYIASKSIEAGTSSMNLLAEPFKSFSNYFSLSSGMALLQPKTEKEAREKVGNIERDINSHEEVDVNREQIAYENVDDGSTMVTA